MSEIYLTAYDGKLLGPIASLLGFIMDKIYIFMYNIFGIENVAVTIIIFTIFIYLCLLPLTYKQQKFSMLTRKMQPELTAVQNKYKNKKDQESMSAMQEETQLIYDKYGVSPMGSCVQALIQMPILFALYRVFYNVPAYITSIKHIFTKSIDGNTALVSGIVHTDKFATKMQKLYELSNLKNVKVDFTLDYSENATTVKNYIVDVLYKLGESGWDMLKTKEFFPNLTDSIDAVVNKLTDINYLFVLNISDTPWNQMKFGWTNGHNILLIFCALLIPLFAYVSQLINIKLMPTSDSGNDQMAQQMKTMNMMMPLMSLFIAFTVPVGLGLYWIAGSVVRIIQQLILNKHFEKIDLEEIVEKNKEKAAKKAEKRGEKRNQIYEAAKMNTKSNSMASKANISAEKMEAIDKANEARKNAKSGSMASKANMVKDFNERNNR